MIILSRYMIDKWAIVHSYVKLPEGKTFVKGLIRRAMKINGT